MAYPATGSQASASERVGTSRPHAWLPPLFDVRCGEGRMLARAAGALFLLIAAHTLLETARDALVLTRLPRRDLGGVYLAVALAVVPVAALTARASRRMAVRVVLAGGLVLTALALGTLFLLPAR